MEQPEKKAQNQKEVLQEMLPFIIYAVVPIVITIGIALTFGTR